ncbi:MAG: hypothetical protein ABL993_00160 [Vicinamibacterales bacterium]
MLKSRIPDPNSQVPKVSVVRSWDPGLGVWILGVVVGIVVCPGEARAQVAMPAPSEIHGKAIPAPELADGIVTVRVVRESIGNNVPGQDVRVIIGGTTRTARTDEQGRAEFRDLPRDQGRAEATVDGERLTSDPFTAPASGGLRVILVAGIARAAERKAQEDQQALAEPAVKGIVVLGAGSRVVLEFQDDALQAFYILEILNNARTRVDIGGPLMIDLPRGAARAATLEGSAPATVSGDRVTVLGPFAPGRTLVQLGFTLDYGSSKDYTFSQTWPVALEQLTMAIEKVGATSMTSPQFATTGEVRAEEGTTYVLGNGPGQAAGSTTTVTLTGLPAHSPVPRYAALTLAGGLLAWGAWMAVSGRGRRQGARARLIAKRDTLLGELTRLEERRRAGQEPPKQAARRLTLLAELEQIYGELDETGTGPGGGGEGVAA